MNDDSEYVDDEALSPQVPQSRLTIHLVGIGCAGGNLLKNISLKDIAGDVRLTLIDTDFSNLDSSSADDVIQVGNKQTRGLGTGGEVQLGRESAREDIDKIEKAFEGNDLVFVFAGLGGGTGSGVTPSVVQAASKAGALVISFVAMPFSFQGRARAEIADKSLQELRQLSDAVIPLPNDVLMQLGREDVNVMDAFAEGNRWIEEAIYSICSLILKPGLINVEFPNLKKAFPRKGGRTLFAIGRGSGENALRDAINTLIQCPLLHISEQTRSPDHLLVNIQGGTSLKMPDINHIMKTISERFCSLDDTIFGANLNEHIQDEVHIMVLGTTDLDSGKPAILAEQHLNIEDTPEFSSSDDEMLKVPVHDSKVQSNKPETKQGEFEFNFNDTGYFDHTEKFYFKEQDLDIPSFHRRNIQIII